MHNKVILRKLHMTTWYSIAELNRIVENMTKSLPSSTENPELLLKFVEKLFKSGKKCLEDGDEEMTYVFFLRYLRSYKKAEEQSKLLENYDNSNGPSWSYKARESQRICSNLAINLKERYHLEIMQASKQLMGINKTTQNEQSSEFKSPLLSSHSFRRKPHTSSRLKGVQKLKTPPPQRTGASMRPTLRDLLTGNNIERSQQHDSSMTEDALSLTLTPEDISDSRQNFTSVIQPELSEPYPNEQAVEIASLVSVKSTTSKLKVQDQILKNKILEVSDLRQLVAKKDIDFKLLQEKYDALLATNNTELESKIPNEQPKLSQTNPSTSTSSKEVEIDSAEKMHRKTEDNKLNAPVVVNKTEGNDKVHELLPKKQKVIEDGSTHLQSITLKRYGGGCGQFFLQKTAYLRNH